MSNENAEASVQEQFQNSTAANAGPITYTTGAVLIAALAHVNDQTIITPEGTPWSQVAENEGVDSGQPINIIENITTSGTSDQADWSGIESDTDSLTAVVSYKKATGGGPTFPAGMLNNPLVMQ
jgi:hypothetical protein